EVGVDYASPILVLHPQDQPVSGDPGVVDQDVESAEAIDDLLDQLLTVVCVGHVGLEGSRIAAVADQLIDNCLGRLCRRRVVDGDLVTGRTQPQGGCP